MKKLIDAHWDFVGLFIVFFAGDVLLALYELVIEKEDVFIVVRDLAFGAIAIAVVLYFALKIWKIKDDSAK